MEIPENNGRTKPPGFLQKRSIPEERKPPGFVPPNLKGRKDDIRSKFRKAALKNKVLQGSKGTAHQQHVAHMKHMENVKNKPEKYK